MQDHLQITYIGHATCLIEHRAGAILTDPHFSNRCLWRRRLQPLAYAPGQLPPLTAVLITHAHYDHCDIESFKYIPSTVPVVTPPKLGPLLHRFINNPIVELAHWAPYELAPDLIVTPVPVRHCGGRAVPNLRYRPTSGYHLRMNDAQIYFAGDTGYGTHFREVGHMYGIDVALLPIGRMLPDWVPFGKAQHLNGLEALQAGLDLKAKHMIPIHWGAFGAATAAHTPVETLRRHAMERQLTDQVHIIESGQKWTLPNKENACIAASQG